MQFAASLTPALRRGPEGSKRLLRRIGRDLLPAEIAARPSTALVPIEDGCADRFEYNSPTCSGAGGAGCSIPPCCAAARAEHRSGRDRSGALWLALCSNCVARRSPLRRRLRAHDDGNGLGRAAKRTGRSAVARHHPHDRRGAQETPCCRARSSIASASPARSCASRSRSEGSLLDECRARGVPFVIEPDLVRTPDRCATCGGRPSRRLIREGEFDVVHTHPPPRPESSAGSPRVARRTRRGPHRARLAFTRRDASPVRALGYGRTALTRAGATRSSCRARSQTEALQLGIGTPEQYRLIRSG